MSFLFIGQQKQIQMLLSVGLYHLEFHGTSHKKELPQQLLWCFYFAMT
jgi:hypothetical protein